MKKILSVCICLGLLIVSMTAVSGILSNKESAIKYQAFIQQDADFDVLFFGTSHMHNAIDPMMLWKDFGIVSYNMANEGCRIATIYWQIRLALDYTTPKLIVVDCAYLNREEKTKNKDGAVHKVLDIYPLSKTKKEAVFDLYDDKDHRERMLFPFSTYHNRWNELTEQDFKPDYNKAKGFVYNYAVCPVRLPELQFEKKADVRSIGVEYLKRIRDLCKEKGIELLLTYLPYEYSEKSADDGVFVYHFAKENSLPCLDGNELRQIVNEETDFINGLEDNSHLNWSGAQKMTAYIGQYIRDHYESVADRRKDKEYKKWKNDYRQYRAEKWRTIRKQTKPEEILVSAFDRELDVMIELNNRDILTTEPFSQLFENIGVHIQNPGDRTIIIRKEGKISYLTEDEALHTGLIKYTAGGSPERVLVFDETEIKIDSLSENEEKQIQIVLSETDSHQKVYGEVFHYQVKELSPHKQIEITEV